jgi:hypothetical protein
MPGPTERKRVLITVRTYPSPARRGVEVSCTAGITDDGQWIRLYPVPYRRMAAKKRFAKYQWIDLNVTKASDPRPESYTPDIDSIEVAGRVPTRNNWEERKRIVLPHSAHCLCCLERTRQADGSPTLGLFRPLAIKRLIIEPDDAQWSPEQTARLRQSSFFDEAPRRELEKIPYKFKYEFLCDDQACLGHSISCTDWEMGESYRKWHRDYREEWEGKFRQRYEREMIELNETYFYVGTLRGHPATWIIVGLFYPRLSPPQGALL